MCECELSEEGIDARAHLTGKQGIKEGWVYGRTVCVCA
jgi:hypothetical protein